MKMMKNASNFEVVSIEISTFEANSGITASLTMSLTFYVKSAFAKIP